MDLRFPFMRFAFMVRDRLRPREKILEEVGLRPGFHVLDFGCGPGSYVEPAARRVGESGRVYALDRNPSAVRLVERRAARRGLPQVHTIHSDGPTGLPDGSVDVVLLYDILHHLTDPRSILDEIHRVLKPEGALSVSDHHLAGADIVARITEESRFVLAQISKATIRFVKKEG